MSREVREECFAGPPLGELSRRVKRLGKALGGTGLLRVSDDLIGIARALEELALGSEELPDPQIGSVDVGCV